MIGSNVLTLDNIILAGYIFSGSLLNIVALFISSFYQHSLHQSSPQAGFVVAVIFSFVYISLLFFGIPDSVVIRVISVISLIGYGVVSAYSIIMLFLVMRSIRK